MFTYFHCYMPETWEAQVRAGLVGKYDGIRFSQSIDIEDSLKFNRLAACHGDLYRMVYADRMPFYIDRLQGGCYIEQYPYDMTLVQKYIDRLGDNFYGFQMHEWMSNFLSDLNKLRTNRCPSWTAADIAATIRQAFPFPHLFLESMSAEEMEATGDPQTYETFLHKSAELFDARQRYTGGQLLPCDSGFLAYPLELRSGARHVMAEIGAQTPDTRIQVAFARGMSRAYGVSFGTYYEPWGGSPFSACSYQRDGKNEWNIRSGADFPFETNGANGGSSRSMQRRMHLYSYMAGASFMAEEWGMCNTFYDWHDFELSPYGQIKKQFLDFVARYGDIGTPVTPIAVVLPRTMDVLESVRSDDLTYLSFPAEGAFADTIRNARRGLRALCCSTGRMEGTETMSLLNCTIPDALDIVTEDVLKPERYDWLVDLTGSNDFARAHAGRICNIYDVASRLDDLLPCIVHGNAMKQLTRTQDGRFYLLLTNNSGIVRTEVRGDECLPDATEHLSVTVKGGHVLDRLEGSSLSRDGHGVYHTDIPAGGYFFAVIR